MTRQENQNPTTQIILYMPGLNPIVKHCQLENLSEELDSLREFLALITSDNKKDFIEHVVVITDKEAGVLHVQIGQSNGTSMYVRVI